MPRSVADMRTDVMLSLMRALCEQVTGGQGFAVTLTSRDFLVHRPTDAQARSPNVIRYRKAWHQVSMTASTEDF